VLRNTLYDWGIDASPSCATGGDERQHTTLGGLQRFASEFGLPVSLD